ncbi:ferrous iron transporter B [Brooklawnia cerclae]|uniref:ferrous iron transporter B n=1 Tax=Brooklawnia cerclae TaxID=349934 RepID=UPI00312C9556
MGNPNAGKSTLFNALTGLSAKVANYPGVTVSRSVGSVAVGDQRVVVEDLPGTYSLDPISPDEQIVARVIEGHEGESPDGVVVVLDATSLRRSLGLLAQVQQTGLPTLVVLTFTDELARRGGGIDLAALSDAVGNQVVPVTAGNRNQLHDLIAQLDDPCCWRVPAVPAPTDPAQVTGWVDSVLTAAGFRIPQVDARTRRIDSVLLHPVWGTVIFLVAMVVFFQVIFTVAAPIQGWIETLFGWLATLVDEYVTVGWLSGLLADGIIGGVGSVLVFLPQIALLFAMIAVLESSGYMSRVAFLMDRVMGRAGLEGRAFVAMLSSVACAVPGIMATRSLPSARDRIATMMTAPLMTCSARLPVYTMLIAMLVPSDARLGPLGLQGLVMFAMYLLGAVSAMGAAWVFKYVLRGKGPALPFYMEMPSYQAPRLSDIGHAVWDACAHFVMRVGRIILVLTIAIWALLSLPVASDQDLATAGVDPTDEVAVAEYQIDNSAAAAVGKTIQPVFEPLGFDWRITVGLLSAMGARETFVATMGQMVSADNPDDPGSALQEMTWISGPHAGQKLFTPGVAAALLVYFAFALQCTSTIAVLKQESGGWKWPVIAFVYLTALAWVSALVVKLVVEAAVG